MDRRTKYTKKIINDTLIKLLSEKCIKKVTVSEICKIAEKMVKDNLSYDMDKYVYLDFDF